MNNMELDCKQQIGIVIESYNTDPLHRVVIVRLRENKSYFFFYVPEAPAIDLGDTFIMNFFTDKYSLCKVNDRLSHTYTITPLIFPSDLLLQLISERLNQ